MVQTTNETMELEFEWKFKAPIDLVFDALTQPEHLKHWHSPNHLNITFTEADLKIGGEYRIGVTVVGGDGTEMMFVGKYVEITKPNVLVYTQAFSPGNNAPLTPETKISIQLTQDGSETIMNFNQSGFTDKRAHAGARMSWPETYEKLGKYLMELK